MRKLTFGLFAIVAALAGCDQSYVSIPPNMIGMMLTPSGYENKIYTPGQINLGRDETNGQGNRLVLIQRSGIEVKEQFLKTNEDGSDHRCLLGNGTPMTFDVRLLLALPDYEQDKGKKDLQRVFMLGNPIHVEGDDPRVSRISAESIYAEQARLQVRRAIRDLCATQTDFKTALKSGSDPSPEGIVKQLEHQVSKILRDKNVPLELVSAVSSNMTPDESVLNAISAEQAAEGQVKAMAKLAAFLDNDPTGSHRLIFQMSSFKEIVNVANSNGHNTIIMSADAAKGGTIVMPTTQRAAAPASAPAAEQAPKK